MWPGFFQNLRGALRRVFPDGAVYAQAVAFGSFLASFPLMMLGLALLAGAGRISASIAEIFERVEMVLPPGGTKLIQDFLVGQGGSPRTWMVIGIVGTLLGGLQVMSGLMMGFRVIYRDSARPGFWRDVLRSLGLLSMTAVPLVAAVVLTVFARQLRVRLIEQFESTGFFNWLWALIFPPVALALSMVSLSLLYHFGRQQIRRWNEAWPGTFVATVLWWGLNTAFGFYVRNVPYSLVYGGLATVIGLLLWMYMSALVVLIGAGYNAERLESAERSPVVQARIFPDAE